MTKNLDSEGLKSIVNNYDLFYIDLWGVVHNGIYLHQEAINVLKKLSDLKKDYVLLTNAPRPNSIVKNFLEKMGMDEKMRNHVFTSGEAALNYLKNNYQNISDSEYILCTGLFDKHEEDLKFYKNYLEGSLKKKMICTNPDLIVDRGDKREFCAGSVAMVFEKMGGEVVYFGKPYPEVYNQSIDNNKKKVLSIGDNLNTDIKGANLLNYDSLLISNGVHKNEIKDNGIEKVSKQYESIVNYMQSDLKW